MPSKYDPSWASETMMDVEAVHTVAPGATIDLIYIPCTSGNLVDGIDYVATNHLANIVSNSWSFSCGSNACSDTQLPSSLILSNHNRLMLDAAQGLTILFASGDSGATPDGVTLGTEFPASDPNVLAVGATDLYLAGCGTLPCSYSSENGSKISGGGFSSYFAEPTWQTSALGIKSGRAVPDVSMFGYDPSFWVYSTSSNKCGISTTATAGWFKCTGTSLATPLWAGFLAIMEQVKGAPLGNVAPSLYALYNGTAYMVSFHDVISGDNKYFVNGYQAGVGWDPVTGLGTPIADKLATVPEFPFAIPILAMSIFSSLVFFRLKSKTISRD
jgi:subtilase family serine protease